MSPRTKQHDHDDGFPAPDGGGGPETNNERIAGLRLRADAVRAVGDEAVQRALSSNSERFNQGIRQGGGQ